MTPQRYGILNHLLKGESLTRFDALQNFGCFELPARICELKDAGYEITTTMERTPLGNKRIARYSMSKAAIRAAKKRMKADA